jgi:FkbM family methyltransferase
MSTKYFVLSKSATDKTDDNTDNHILHLNPGKRNVFLLPEVNLDYYWRKGLFECQLIEWTKQFCKSDKKFLDIGAHTGTYAISLASKSQEVIAFEPQRSTYYALCGSVAASGLSDKIVCIQCGLGSDEQVGTQELKIVSNDGGGSSLAPAENERVIREETIEVRTLDSFELRNIGVIKMDVENNELNVLRGALETLRESNYPPILFESNGPNLDVDESRVKLFGFLKQAMNYKVISIGGVSNMYLACRE